MGCGNSSLVQDFSDDKNSSVENNKKGKKTESIKEHACGQEEINDKLEDITQRNKNAQDSAKFERRTQMPSKLSERSGNGAANAWVAMKKEERNFKNSQQETAQQSQTLKQLKETSYESEYGRDGVDLNSASFISNGEKLEKRSLRNKNSLDENGFLRSYGKGAKNPALIRQEESEETFDPSTLIDMQKFKAANAPVTQSPSSVQKTPELTKKETDNNQETNYKKNEFSSKPSNNQEFYDDDEKILIESIERDFLFSPSPVLPGAAVQ